MSLEEYEHVKFELAAILRSVWRETDAAVERASKELFGRLAEDRFNIVVMGRFNRGKTSIMNAMLSTTALPVGVVPLTSVVTTVAYGSSELAAIEYENRHLPDRVPVARLAEYVTETGNPGNIRRVKAARVELQSDILLRGFFLIDTPGLGSSILENTRTTEAFFPEADALILVTSYESPLSDDELRVLVRATESGRHVFILLNKRDTVSAESARIIEDHVGERLSHVLGVERAHVFSVSAHTKEGLADFERELVRFLIEEKESQFIRGMCARVGELLATLPGKQTELERLESLIWSLDNASMRMALAEGRAHAGGARRSSGCVMCQRVQNALYAFLCRYQYDLIADENERRLLAEQGGLCAAHIWLYASVANSRGVCIALTELARRTVERLRDLGDAAQRETHEPQCRLCAALAEREDQAARELAERISFHQPKDNIGVCLPHLSLLVAFIASDEDLSKLFEMQAQTLERVCENMQRYILKQDALRRDLLTLEEDGAAHNVLAFFGANEVVVNPLRRRGEHRALRMTQG